MSGSALDVRPEITPQAEEFYGRMSKKNIAPLWEVLASIVPYEPKTPFLPALWRFEEDVRPLLTEAGEFITAKAAERRVLMLMNPGKPESPQITGSLYAGIQLVNPGEVAPTHHHTASALRFVMESRGGYTSVDGERTIMQPGDFIVTPSWTWHDHGNPGDGPVVWLDVLDIPIINMMDCSFAEHYPTGEIQPVTKREHFSTEMYGANMFPVDYEPVGKATPLFSYPYSKTLESLDLLARNSPLHPSHGYKLRFVNPATGGSPLPNIATFMQQLPRGFKGEPYRATDATIYAVAEGTGSSMIGGTTLNWKKHDVFVVPSWFPVKHETSAGAVLFSASDRPLQKLLGTWREQAPVVS